MGLLRAAVVALALGSCGRAPEAPTPDAGHVVFKGTAMGSSLGIEVYGADNEICERAVAAARAEIDRLDVMMTTWKPFSRLMDVNNAAGGKAVKTTEEILFLVRRSLELSEMTEGAFDISFGAAGKLWKWRDPDPRIPTPGEVKASLENVGWQGVILDEKAGTVRLANAGMKISLDAIAPGYAGDRAIEAIRSFGIRNAMVNMSGDVFVLGTKEGGPWKVSIRHPEKADASVAVLPVSDTAVSTSGNYERCFVKNGKRYGHIIDPRSGYPADGCLSATVLAPTLAYADGLATAVFVLGPEKGMALIEKLEGVEGLIVAADGTVLASSGLKR